VDSPPYVPGYLLEHQLGANGYGSVWGAREESTGAVVAVKLLPMPSPQQRAHALRESSRLSAIDHPHVVPFYGAVEVEGGLALITALADGGSLGELLAARGVLSAGEVVTISAPLAEALAEAHARGLVHGDITPENVVFTRDGRPMVTDLGLSRLTGERPRVPVGFAPPEVEAGQWAGPAADVYGLAVLVVLSLTGYLPGKPLTLPGIAPAASGALARSLHPDPDRRLDADSLSNAMFALADPEPVGLATDTGEFDQVSGEFGRPDDGTGELAESPAGPRRAPSRRARRDPDGGEEPLGLPPSTNLRTRRRDILVGLAILIAVPVVAIGGYAVWNQLTGNPDAAMLPGAGRVTAPADAEGESDLCGGPQPAPTQAPPDVSDWTPVVERLLAARAEAFNVMNPELLCQVFSPVSPHLAIDYDLMQEYSDASLHPTGLRHEVINVELVSEEGDVPVVLEITDRIPPHQLVDESGEVAREIEGEPETTWRAELVVTPDASGWQFS
jgi:serine/threonine protein kinase